ncbi:MAG: LURP-one-related/scramblase family protein, partial [Actinomycetes bacterium]
SVTDTGAPHMKPAQDGRSRFIMKSKLGAGRDFHVTDTSDQLAYIVDGKMGTRPKAEINDASGATLYNVKGHLVGIPKQMTISDAGGSEVGSLHAKMISPIKSKATLSMSDGTEWHVEGSLVEKNYRIDSAAGPVAEISQKWVTVRDSYAVDVVDGVDPGLVLAVVWAIDRWVERD